jgi:hypothetical protein
LWGENFVKILIQAKEKEKLLVRQEREWGRR